MAKSKTISARGKANTHTGKNTQLKWKLFSLALLAEVIAYGFTLPLGINYGMTFGEDQCDGDYYSTCAPSTIEKGLIWIIVYTLLTPTIGYILLRFVAGYKKHRPLWAYPVVFVLGFMSLSYDFYTHATGVVGLYHHLIGFLLPVLIPVSILSYPLYVLVEHSLLDQDK